METKNIETQAKEKIATLLGEGLDFEAIQDAYRDGSYLAEVGYTEDDQELIDAIGALVDDMIEASKNKVNINIEATNFLGLANNEIEAQKTKLTKNIIKVAQGKKSFSSLTKTLYKAYQTNSWYRMLKEAIDETKEDESKAQDFAFFMLG